MAAPPEPSIDDPVVTTAAELTTELARAVTSLHIIGHIRLGGLPTDPTGSLLSITLPSNRVTLWSTEGGTLDAEGAGRNFAIAAGAQVRFEGLHITGGNGGVVADTIGRRL